MFAFKASRGKSVQLKDCREVIADGLKLGLNFLHFHGIVQNDISFQNFKKSGQDILLRVVLCDSWLSILNEQNR